MVGVIFPFPMGFLSMVVDQMVTHSLLIKVINYEQQLLHLEFKHTVTVFKLRLFCVVCWPGKTYRFRISNVGLTTSINFRIQGHKMLLVEVEGTHSLQNTYDSLDIHLGQSYSVLVTADQAAHDYFIVVSTRFTSQVLTTTSTLHYSNSAGSVSDTPLGGPTIQIDWSLEQARSLRYFQIPVVELLIGAIIIAFMLIFAPTGYSLTFICLVVL